VKKASVLSIFGSDPIFLLRGGIGNQLFIYSAGIYLGQRDSFNPIFHSLGIDHGESISEMGLPGRFMTANMLQVYRLDRRFSQRFSKREMQVISSEDDQIEIKKRSYVSGYFQKAEFANQLKINGHFDHIINQKPKTELIAKCHEISESNSTILHLRFGDYLGAARNLGNLTLDYYKSILASEKAITSNPIYVMSDDFVKAREFLIDFSNLDIRMLDEFHGLSSITQLKIFGSSNRIICANSTYSWWGAFLSPRANKVWAPSPWFKDAKMAQGVSAIYPENFIKVKSVWK
jgi:hypothetical protein